MFKDPDGFEYEETPEHLAMMSFLTQVDEAIRESKKQIMDEINKINGGKKDE